MMDLKTIGKWVYLVGLIVAVLAALFGFMAEWLGLILLLVGIFVGVVYADTDDLTNFAIRYIALGMVVGAVDALPWVGGYITTIFTAMYGFLGPILLTALFMWFIKKYFKGSDQNISS